MIIVADTTPISELAKVGRLTTPDINDPVPLKNCPPYIALAQLQ